MSRATAVAPSNIALVKYWGKRDAALNLPATGSLSMTLSGLTTRTTVTFGAEGTDRLVLDGRPVPAEKLGRHRRLLDEVRGLAGITGGATIVSCNDFPTGAGLASSASGMAALAMAAAAAAGLDLDATALSRLARLGSGSACRSLFGGFAEWVRGERDDGLDSVGVQIAPPEHWPLELLVAVVEEGPKSVSSTTGMEKTAATSPYYRAWLEGVTPHLEAARHAIRDRDFDALALIAEQSAIRMHAAMMTAEPSLLYWRPGTVAAILAVRALRAGGAPVFFTIDAGPNVKVVTPPGAAGPVAEALAAVPGIRRVIPARVGPGAHLDDGHLEE
jgi:diphosphomevalonate decarboxylase